MTDEEKALFVENNKLKTENTWLKQQNKALNKRIAQLEEVPEFERIKRRTAYCAATQQTEGQ